MEFQHTYLLVTYTPWNVILYEMHFEASYALIGPRNADTSHKTTNDYDHNSLRTNECTILFEQRLCSDELDCYFIVNA